MVLTEDTAAVSIRNSRGHTRGETHDHNYMLGFLLDALFTHCCMQAKWNEMLHRDYAMIDLGSVEPEHRQLVSLAPFQDEGWGVREQ